MKPVAQILVTAVLVACGIFIYDSMKGSGHDASANIPDARPADLSALDARLRKLEGRESPALVSGGYDALAVRVAALEKRFGPSAAPTSGKPAPGTPTETGTTPAGVPIARSDASSTGTAAAEGSAGRAYTEDEIAWLRPRIEEVERRRREEQQVAAMKSQFQALGLHLTPEQESAVIAETMKMRTKQGELWRGGFKDDQDRQEKQAASVKIRDEYTQALQGIVSASDAEKIAGATPQRGGFFMGPGGGMVVPMPAPPAPTAPGR